MLAGQALINLEHGSSNTPGTIYIAQQHDFDYTMKKKSDQGEAWHPNTPFDRETEGDTEQLIPTPQNNTQGLRQQKDKNKVTRPKIYVSPISKYQVSERHAKQYHAHGNFTPRMSRLGQF